MTSSVSTHPFQPDIRQAVPCAAGAILTVLAAVFLLLSAMPQAGFCETRPMLLSSAAETTSIFDRCDYLEDPSQRLTISDVASAEMAPRFTPLAGRSENLGYSASTLWIRFTLSPEETGVNSRVPEGWIIENRWRFLSRFSLFTPGGTREGESIHWTELKGGARHLWEVEGRSGFPMALPLPDITRPTTFYLCVESWGIIVLNLNVTTKAGFLAAQQTHRDWQFIFIGVVSALLLYNLLLSTAMRYPGHVHYMCWVFFMALSMFRANGPSVPLLSQVPPEVDDRLIQLTAALAHLFFCQFSRLFLNLKAAMPKLDRFMKSLIALYGLGLIGMLILPFSIVEMIVNNLSVALVVSMAVACRHLILKRSTEALYFSIAFLAIILCWFVYILSYYEVVPMDISTALLGIQLGSALEAILLSLGMAHKINLIQKTKQVVEKRFESLFNTISDFVFTHDTQGRILSVNPAVCQGIGLPESRIVGRFFEEFVTPEYRKKVREEYLPQVMKFGRHAGLMLLKDQKGETQYLDYRVVLNRDHDGKLVVSGTGHTVTERILAHKEVRTLRDQLLHAQKMEAMGTLTSGIAHDFNNLLQSILGPLSIIRKKGSVPQDQERYFSMIETSSVRGAALIRQLMSFSRKNPGDLKPVNLSELVKETVNILKETFPKLITLELRDSDAASLINADPGQIQQMILNLALNARDAMPGGGTITFDIFMSRPETLPGHLEVLEGEYVILTVSDTGTGIPTEIQKKIFEPFFTTKGKDKGTGLGLAMVYGIVTSHRGAITCDSTPGTGTTFTVYFPALERVDDTGPSEGETVQPVIETGRSVLLVEDEAYILEIVKEILLMYEFTVFEASNGQEALDLFKKHESAIDLMIVDLNMPVMGGLEFLNAVKELGSKTRAIVTTGSSELVSFENTGELSPHILMGKPYTPEQLLRKIRTLLQAGL